jgi:hypothetical protein
LKKKDILKMEMKNLETKNISAGIPVHKHLALNA